MHDKVKLKKLKMLAVMMVGILAVVCLEIVKAEAPLNAKPFDMTGQYLPEEWITETDKDNGIWYRIDVPSDGLIEIRIMSYCEGSLSFSLHNQDLSQRYKFTSCDDYVKAGSEASPTTGTVSKALSAGTYYFHLSGTVGRYKLMGTFTSFGANDAGANSYDSPYNYTLSSSITGALTETDTEDWYKVTIPSSGKYELKIISYCEGSLSYKLQTYDLASTIVNSSVSGGSNTTPKTVTAEKILSAGTYYVKVSGTTGKYIMSFSSSKNLDNMSVSVTARKNKKKVYVYTAAQAQVKVQYGGKTWKKATNGYGKATINIKKKLKKGKKVKVTVTKSGYKTAKVTVKVR